MTNPKPYQLQYYETLNELMNNPDKEVKTRVGDAKSRFSEKMKIDLRKEFPLMNIKQTSFKNICVELLWFIAGDTNIKFLNDNGCKIWNDDYKRWNADKNVDDGDLGQIYGFQWRHFGGRPDRISQPKPRPNITFELIVPNKNHDSKYVGMKFESKNHGEFVVIDHHGNDNYSIQFLSTGSIVENVTSSHIKTGEIKNRYAITCFGVGSIGKRNNQLDRGVRKLLYITWRNILARCYDKTHVAYNNYGGRGVYVDNRWLCFEYFAEDAVQLDGWDKKLKNTGQYQLDKDLKHGFKYSKDTCCWIPYYINQALLRDKIITFKNLDTNQTYVTNNLSEFGRKFNFGKNFPKYGYLLTNGRIKKYKNWIVEKVVNKHQGFDQLQDVINTLKTNPDDRRMIITAHNPADIANGNVALPSCHNYMQYYTQPIPLNQRIKVAIDKGLMTPELSELADTYVFYKFGKEQILITNEVLSDIDTRLDAVGVPKRYISTFVNLRSWDFFLGAPYNVASYALLTHMVAQCVNMIPCMLSINGVDTHLYKAHEEAATQWMDRVNEKMSALGPEENAYQLFEIDTKLELNPAVTDITKFTLTDCKVTNYQSLGKIEAPLLT